MSVPSKFPKKKVRTWCVLISRGEASRERRRGLLHCTPEPTSLRNSAKTDFAKKCQDWWTPMFACSFAPANKRPDPTVWRSCNCLSIILSSNLTWYLIEEFIGQLFFWFFFVFFRERSSQLPPASRRLKACTSRFEPGRVSSPLGDFTNRARLGLQAIVSIIKITCCLYPISFVEPKRVQFYFGIGKD